MNDRRQRQQQHRGYMLFGLPHLFFLFGVAILVSLTLPSEYRMLHETQVNHVLQKVILKDDSYPPPTNGTYPSADHSDSLEMVWLMSFPNSGTSYTSKLVRHTTLTNSATNYGHENRGLWGDSEPVYADQPNGPFWMDPTVHPEYSWPTRYVMTKTHCGGRCETCPPHRYVETMYSFRRACASGRRARMINGTKVVDEVTYEDTTSRVKKAIHLIRDPFDNVVSRFHLETHSKSATNVPKTREGFREYCFGLNQEYEKYENVVMFLDDDLLEIVKDVPCRADFFRYVEWHNLAFVTAQELELETLIIHYDWYETDLKATTEKLLDFLALEPRAAPEVFVRGKIYKDYFTAEERKAVEHAMKRMASRATWEQIERYF